MSTFQEEIGKPQEIAPILEALCSLDRMKAMATLGGLLARPDMQSNCYRIEALIHMAARFATGQKKPPRELVADVFDRMGAASFGRMEDPAEDVFVSVVSNKNGTFRIFTGLLEGSGFYLQRFLDLLESMPVEQPFERMRRSIEALLRLSEALAARAGLQRHSLGGDHPLEIMPDEVRGDLGRSRKWVTFTNDELKELGVERKQLQPFVFPMEQRESLDGYIPGHSPLERHPIIADKRSIVLALPTTVSAAIRRYMIEECLGMGLEDRLSINLGQAHAQILRGSISFGGPHSFAQKGGFLISNTLQEFDTGHWLHTLAFVDDFKGYSSDGLMGLHPNRKQLATVLEAEIEEWAGRAKSQFGFRKGLTLLVSCGWGRGFVLPFHGKEIESWNIESIGIHDLEVLASLPDYKPRELWKTLEMSTELKRMGVETFNVNGILNLVGWENYLDGHHVPHPDLPEGFASSETPALLSIPTNLVRDLRHRVANLNDEIRLPNRKGEWLPVRRTDASFFPEDSEMKIYGALEEAKRGRLLGAYPSEEHVWWVEIKGSGSTSMLFKHWEMLLHWLGRSARVLEAERIKLPNGPITWIVELGVVDESYSASEFTPPDDPWSLYSCLVSKIDCLMAEIHLRIPEDFQPAFFFPENHAERMLIRALVEATLKLGGGECSHERLRQILDRICPDVQARHIHMWHGREFRDQVRSTIPDSFLAISNQDSARVKLGLGRPAGSGNIPSTISGVNDCRTFLNSTVERLEDELCRSLQAFNRRSLIYKVMLNHESAAVDQTHWRRTASAILALRSNKQEAMQVIVEKESSRNAVAIASRVLVEAAICECPDQGGITPGDLDLGKLMALASSIFHLGGVSNAINKGVKEPELRISPLGDIMSKHGFEDEVIEPYGRVGTEKQVTNAISEYPEQYEPPVVLESVEDRFDPEFVSAWKAEVGFSIDQGRRIIELIEDEGTNLGVPIFAMSASALITLSAGRGIGRESAATFVASMSLPARPSWKTIPEGYLPQDREPWRFRRRLSMMRKPLVALDGSDDPHLLIVPGLLREAFIYVLRGFHEGSFPDKTYPTSKEMSKWLGRVKNERGKAFNKMVEARMLELGWKAVCELKVTELLSQGFPERDYGDVDVFAWDERTGRILVMECKDLLFGKTPGEIAHQLTEFLGEQDERGRRDSLRKHLDRMDVISRHLDKVMKYAGLVVPPRLESHLVFRHPVPMQFAWKDLQAKARLSLFEDLGEL